MEFSKIRELNKRLNSIDIKGKKYNTVNQRVLAFRELWENGSIETELIYHESGMCVIKATIKDNDGKIISTGLSYEIANSSFINNTSYIENCETSAVGRALGFLGIGITESIASAEEVQTAMNNQNSKQTNCKKCGKELTPAEKSYSMKEYKIPLCVDCQELAKNYYGGKK